MPTRKTRLLSANPSQFLIVYISLNDAGLTGSWCVADEGPSPRPPGAVLRGLYRPAKLLLAHRVLPEGESPRYPGERPVQAGLDVPLQPHAWYHQGNRTQSHFFGCPLFVETFPWKIKIDVSIIIDLGMLRECIWETSISSVNKLPFIFIKIF